MRLTRSLIGTLLTMLTCLSGLAWGEDPTLEIYETYMLPHKVAAAVDSALKPGETIRVFGNKLIVRASDDSHQKIIKILKEIDRPPHNFLISVRSTDEYEAKKSYRTTEIDVIDDNTVVHINRQPPPEDGVIVFRGSSRDGGISMSVTAKDNLTTNKDQVIYQVRALEGTASYISTGNEIPVTQLVWANGQVLPTTTLDRAISGFYVTPYFSKGEVMLEISYEQQQRSAKSQPEKDTTSVTATLRVPVSEWAPLAGMTGIGKHTQQGHVYSTRDSGQRQQGIEIKVETLN